MSSLALVAFIAGMLTILAPCVLPVLPVILAGSLGEKKSWYPFLVTASLATSIVLFTILLKASTLLIDIPLSFWSAISGIILVWLGLVYVFPHAWTWIASKLGFGAANITLDKTQDVSSPALRAILTGAALGPVFSTCSPTYALLLATVFPVSFVSGIIYTLIYALGLSLILVLIILGWRGIIAKFRIYADERWWFRKTLGIILILIGLSIITGFDKKIEAAAIEKFDITKLEQSVLEIFIPREWVSGDEEWIWSATLESTGSTSPNFLIKNPTQAPELVWLTSWINSDPLTLASLKWKVVLIDFWTYSCINCQRTLPYLKEWDTKYRDKWLVIIGVHAPEFAFERLPENVQKAVQEANIEYPVALDNTFSTWKAFNNQYWPAKYFIDREGNLRHYHFGEGAYAESEQMIQYLLGLPYDSWIGQIQEAPRVEKSPETYLWKSRRAKLVTSDNLNPDEWRLDGKWDEVDEYITSVSGSKLSYHFRAKDVYLVLGWTGTVRVSNDKEWDTAWGKDVVGGLLTLDGERMYHLLSYDSNQVGIVNLDFSPGIRAYAFTFGSTKDSPSENTLHGYMDFTPDILASALVAGKKVILYFHADWCPTCVALEKDIAANPNGIPVDTLLLKIDYDTESELKRKYKVVTQHTNIYLNWDGTEESRLLGWIRIKDILNP